MFMCERCGHETPRLGDLKKHLERKIPCSPKLCDVPLFILFEKLFAKKNDIIKKFKCDYCDKGFSSPQGKYHHKKICKFNEASNELIDEPLSYNVEQLVENEVLTLLLSLGSSDEHKAFIESFHVYLKYDPQIDFVIDLNIVYEWIGFKSIDNAIITITKRLIKGTQYKKEKDTIMLTVKGFKHLCMSVSTDKAKRIRGFYIEMEEALNHHMAHKKKSNKDKNIFVANELT